MTSMELATVPVSPSEVAARERCIVRGQRLVQVKFVALPPQGDAAARGETRGWLSRLIRVIGRLVAARP
jgi:hypothetical protein